LSARVPTATLPEEIVPLVQRLNEFLHRLDEAFARERSLTADIAHELRTPVAGILSTAGVTLSADRAPAEYQEALEDVRGIARRMRSMIENLLTLARLDFQPAQFQFEPVNLREMIENGWRGYQEKAAGRGLAFENAVPGDLCSRSDRNALSIVFVNLLENAVEYANANGRIGVTARRADGVVEVEVRNTGCQLTAQQATHVFDRFWRADPSRKDANLHVGLGLALVRRIMTSLGGAVEATAAGGEFAVQVSIPAARKASILNENVQNS
jgi:two-component system heavy metal sensor histidine kinase CusS